jgi:hypothetical protein
VVAAAVGGCRLSVLSLLDGAQHFVHEASDFLDIEGLGQTRYSGGLEELPVVLGHKVSGQEDHPPGEDGEALLDLSVEGRAVATGALGVCQDEVVEALGEQLPRVQDVNAPQLVQSSVGVVG